MDDTHTNQPRTPLDRPLWSVDDLATHLGVSHRTVFRWHAERRGPKTLRVGCSLRFRTDDVEEWLEERVETDQPARSIAPALPTNASSAQDLDDAFWRSA